MMIVRQLEGNFCNWWGGECGHLPIKWKLYTTLSEGSSRSGFFKVDQNLHLFTSNDENRLN